MECKFKDIETAEGLMQKSSAELYSCGCERCQPVAEKKELAELRAEKQTQLAQEAVRKEEMEKIKQLENAVKGFEDLIESVRLEEREKLMKEKGLDKKGFLNNPMFHQWMNNNFVAPQPKSVYANTRFGREQLSPEMKNFLTWARDGEVLYKDLMSDGSAGNNGGGYVVPEEFEAQVIKERDRVSVVRRAGARVLNVSTDKIHVPIETARGSNGAIRDQATQMADNSPTLDEIILTPYDWTDMVKVHRTMMSDSLIDLAEYLSSLFGRRLGRFENDKFINGTGTNEPKGLDADTALMTSVTSTTNTAETIRNVYFSLEEQYRNNAVWLMNGNKMSQLVQFLNNNNLSWMVSYRDGVPAALLGRPIFEVPDIKDVDGTDGDTNPDPGRSKIFFGDMSYYLVANRSGLTLARSADAYFAERKIAFAAEARFDMKLGVKGSSLRPFAYATAEVFTA
jgi:HK97 family phage major capsid protein